MKGHERNFAWQQGYGAFSVSASNLPAVTSYIDNQAEHHKTRDFRNEFLAMLRRHRVAFDSKYVFD